MKKIFIILFTFLNICLYSQPEKINFSKLSNLDGLSQNSGKCIIQDKRGFIWIATELGLNRYDGYNFKIYDQSSDPKHNLSNIYVNTIIEDSRGNIVVGNDGGVDYLNFETDIIDHYLYDPENTENIYVWAILEDSDNRIWIGSSKGLYKLDPVTKNIEHFEFNNQFKYNGIGYIVEEKKDFLLLSTYNGLIRYDIINNNFSLVDNSPEAVGYIFKNNENEIFVFSYDKGPLLYNVEKKLFSDESYFLKNIEKHTESVSRICKDINNNLWIATDDSGLIYFDSKNKNFKKYQHDENYSGSISSNKLFSVFLDKGGVLWVGTFFDGINFFDTKRKPFNHYFTDKKGTKLGGINGIITDNANNVWYATYKGVVKYDITDNSAEYFVHKPDKNSIAGTMITCLVQDSEGFLWFGSDDNGLSCYNPKTKKFTNYFPTGDSTSISGVAVWAIDVDKNDNIWIGYWGNGIDCFDKKTGIFKNYSHNPDKNSLSVDNINTIKVSPEGKIWIGTWEGGLNVLDPKTGIFEIYKYKANDTNSISQNNIMSISFDSENNTWIGTFSAGVCKIDPKTGKIERFNTSDGLPSNTVQGIIEDNNKNMWFSTSNGLCKYTPQTGQFRVYDITDGIQAKEFSQHGYFKTKSGKILFSGSNGFNYFNPDSIIDNNYSPEIQIIDFKISNQSVKIDSIILFKHITLTDKIKLKYNQRDISFEISALHFENPSKILYSYKLEGYDKEWKTTTANNRIINYTNLDAGEYTLYIKATNCDLVWSENIKTIDIQIVPPFYRTKIFYVFSIVFLIAIVFFVMKIRELKLKKDKEILEAEVKKRTLEIEQQKEEIMSQNEELQVQKEEIEKQRDIANMQKQEILSSISYAQKIQKAILPSQKVLDEILPENFLIFRPRNIVSGDFYWVKKIKNLVIVAVADCTGHGVPGAFMSILGYSFLNEIITKFSLDSTAEILNRLRKKVKESLRQTGQENEQKDGMDIALYILNNDTLNISYSGAYNPLWIVRNKELIELNADRQPIGVYFVEKEFTVKTLQLQKNDCLYTFSDGFADQFGGAEKNKFMAKNFKTLVSSIAENPMNIQKELIIKTFEEWKNGYEQVDDVIIFGVKV